MFRVARLWCDFIIAFVAGIFKKETVLDQLDPLFKLCK